MNWAGILHPSQPGRKLLVLCLFLFSAESLAGVVLLYHHVAENTPAVTSVPVSEFSRHLEIIEEEEFEVVSLEQLVANATSGGDGDANGESNARQVAITFDDAYRDIYTNAFPLLVERRWPFTIFVSTDYIGSNKHYLTWQQLSEMSRQGATIANHSMSHTHFIRGRSPETIDDWLERIRTEITGAEALLTENGFPGKLLAWPYGEYNRHLLTLAKDLGYVAFGQQSGAIGPTSNLQMLPRFPIAGRLVNEQAFRDKLRSLAMPAPTPDIDPLTLSGKPVLQLDFDPKISAERLACFGPEGRLSVQFSGASAIIQGQQALPAGRSRFNCTLPGPDRRYYWFSQLWVSRQADGSWASEH